jgi:hypothetical protein
MITSTQYDHALRLYRGGFVDEWGLIADHTGLSETDVESLVLEGAMVVDRPGSPPERRPSFVSVLQDQLARAKSAQMDWAMANAESASAVAKVRRDTLPEAARIERALVGAWGVKIRKASAEAKARNEPPDLADLLPPKGTAAALRSLRVIMDQTTDIRAPGELFSGQIRDDSGEREAGEWSLVDDLRALDDEQMEAYIETGKIPKIEGKQSVLAFAHAARDAG